jgi:hypothetical protein
MAGCVIGAEGSSTVHSASVDTLSSRVVQYYGRQIKAVVASGAAFLVLSVVAWSDLMSIPQSGFATIAEMFATLLGLTFAAFSVLTALMPSVPKDFLKSRTFLMFGQTFVVTMWLQLVAVLGAGLCYLGYGNRWATDVGPVIVLVAILSVAFLLVVVHYMLYLFKLVRKGLAGEGAPDHVI